MRWALSSEGCGWQWGSWRAGLIRHVLAHMGWQPHPQQRRIKLDFHDQICEEAGSSGAASLHTQKGLTFFFYFVGWFWREWGRMWWRGRQKPLFSCSSEEAVFCVSEASWREPLWLPILHHSTANCRLWESPLLQVPVFYFHIWV